MDEILDAEEAPAQEYLFAVFVRSPGGQWWCRHLDPASESEAAKAGYTYKDKIIVRIRKPSA